CRDLRLGRHGVPPYLPQQVRRTGAAGRGRVLPARIRRGSVGKRRQHSAGIRAKMAGPGDNTRNRPKSGSDTDAFKRSVVVCMRAISGDKELEVAFAKDRPALAGSRARLPDPPKKPSRMDVAVTRG